MLWHAGSGQTALTKQSKPITKSSAHRPDQASKGPTANLKRTTSKQLLHSPLYAASEGEESECESPVLASQPGQPTHGLPTVKEQQQQKVSKPPLPNKKQPAQHVLQADAKPAAKARQTAVARKGHDTAVSKGSKRQGKNSYAFDGFDLLSEDNRPQPEPRRAKQVLTESKQLTKPTGKQDCNVPTSTADGAKLSSLHHQKPQQSKAGHQGNDPVCHAANLNADGLMNKDKEQTQTHAAAKVKQCWNVAEPVAKLPPQIAAAQQVQAALGSAQDPEWLAIAEKVLDAPEAYHSASDADVASPAAHRSPAPKHKYAARQKAIAKVCLLTLLSKGCHACLQCIP